MTACLALIIVHYNKVSCCVSLSMQVLLLCLHLVWPLYVISSLPVGRMEQVYPVVSLYLASLSVPYMDVSL